MSLSGGSLKTVKVGVQHEVVPFLRCYHIYPSKLARSVWYCKVYVNVYNRSVGLSLPLGVS